MASPKHKPPPIMVRPRAQGAGDTGYPTVLPLLPGTGRPPLDRVSRQYAPPPTAFPVPPPSPIMRALDEAGLLGQDAGPAGLGPVPERVHEPGGDRVRQFLHPGFLVVDRLFRKLPEDAMYSPSLNPDRPFQFVIGAYEVPRGMQLWMSDYQFGVLLLDGTNPGDFRYAEDGRFSGSLLFDLTVNEDRQGDLAYELDPQPIVFTRPQFQAGAPIGTPAGSVPEPAASFASVAGIGSSGLPMQREVQGPHNRNPWDWPITEGQTIAGKCAVFRRLRTPIAGIFFRLAGHLLHAQTAKALEERLRPR